MDISRYSDRKDFLNTFLLVILYAIGFYALQFFLYKAGFVNNLPSEINLPNSDASWYRSIAKNGYVYEPGITGNTGFFFLFPFIWKILHVGVWGICIVNILFFAIGFSILGNLYKTNVQNKIFWLSVPTVYFSFVPYTEALFFLLASFMLYGIRKKNTPVIWLSLFLLSLTRSTAIFLAPSLLLMSLLATVKKDWYKSLYSFGVLYLLPIALGLAAFIYIQYLQTGVWFAYFIQQSSFWNRRFSLPTLPFDTFAGLSTLWFSALAMFTGFFCFLFLIQKFFKWLIKNEVQDSLLIVSAGYLFMALLVVVFYNPTWGTNTTNVIGAFRYTFMSPFFYVVLYHFSYNQSYSAKHYLLIFLLSVVAWLPFGAYKHILFLCYFFMDTVLIMLFMLYSNKKIAWPVIIMTAVNLFFQIEFFQRFIGSAFPD